MHHILLLFFDDLHAVGPDAWCVHQSAKLIRNVDCDEDVIAHGCHSHHAQPMQYHYKFLVHLGMSPLSDHWPSVYKLR